jgi:serine/threonine-protein kinase RsbT
MTHENSRVNPHVAAEPRRGRWGKPGSGGVETRVSTRAAEFMNDAANPKVADERFCETVSLSISTHADVLAARQKGREFAMRLGFVGSDVTLIAAAVCEIARNIVDYAQHGEITFSSIDDEEHPLRTGMLVVACDQGPGIADVDQALRYGCATRKGLGVGLPGAKWLMDEFQIDSEPGNGTTVKMAKWLPQGESMSR